MPPESRPSADGRPLLSVMSFNVRTGRANDGENRWENRREGLAALVREQRPNVLGLQEPYREQLDYLLAALPEYAEVGVGRDDGRSRGEHSQVLFLRERFRLHGHGTFWFSETPETPGSRGWGARLPRICTWARLEDLEAERFFYVYNLHLDHESQPAREQGAALLLERVAGREHPDPVLLTGDFNAGETNPAVRLLLGSRAPVLQDTFRVLHPEERQAGTFHGFHGGPGGERIDYIFASEEFQVREAAILTERRGGRYPSDHYPITARLVFRNA